MKISIIVYVNKIEGSYYICVHEHCGHFSMLAQGLRHCTLHYMH